MITYTPYSASDETLIDIDITEQVLSLAAALDDAAARGDRSEVERLMRIVFVEQLPALCGPANDHAIMRAQA